MKRLRLDEQQLQPRLKINMPETPGGGGDSELTRGPEVRRSRSQASLKNVILNLFQDLVIRCEEAKRHKCEVFNVKKINNLSIYPSLKPKAAFTLAEVLITLGIIGVVAAMTMPVLINNIRNKQLETAFKAAYSILSQAVITVAEEQGGALRSSFAISEERPDGSVYYPDAKIVRDSLFSKLKVAGTCTYTGNVRNYSKTTDNPFIDRGTVKPSKALANGMCFDIYVNAAEINLTIDVNGTKGPNILGYDIFFFDIDKKDRLNPKRATGYYSEEELEQLFPGDEPQSSAQSPSAMQLGDPCSINATQRGNGLGCAYYALIDKNPDDEAKGYWESLR